MAENQPLLHVWRTNPLTAAAIASFPAAALMAMLVLAGESKFRRDFGFLVASFAFLVAAMTMMQVIRAYSYAIWLGMPLVAALALRTGAPVVPVFALPIGAGRYRMIYEHPVEPPRADSAQAIRDFTQRCTDVLEMYVRRHPDLWLWMHRRWRDNGPSLDGVPGMFPVAEKDVEEPV